MHFYLGHLLVQLSEEFLNEEQGVLIMMSIGTETILN